MDQAHSIQTTLLHLLELALEEEDQGRARILSDTACQAGAILGLMDYAALSAPFQLDVYKRQDTASRSPGTWPTPFRRNGTAPPPPGAP